jgi:hypothetical protein
MTPDSKIFVGLRSTRKKPAATRQTSSIECQWDGCENGATHKAPVGRDGEGLYLMFCAAHLKEYTAGYNFAPNLSSPQTARYQREAAEGSRKTFGTRVTSAAEVPLPSTARSGSAKALNARAHTLARNGSKPAAPVRKLKVLEAKAFDTLGLPYDATPEEIRARYKQRLKMHHPDANQGDRNSEDRLQASIDAHKILKLNGFC